MAKTVIRQSAAQRAVVRGGENCEIVLESIVTAPVSAKALPLSIVAPVLSVMLSAASRFPSNAVVDPSVAELPTFQNNPLSVPPCEPTLIILTDAALAVVRVLPI